MNQKIISKRDLPDVIKEEIEFLRNIGIPQYEIAYLLSLRQKKYNSY